MVAEDRLKAYLEARGIKQNSIKTYLGLWRQVSLHAFDPEGPGQACLFPEDFAERVRKHLELRALKGLAPASVRNQLVAARYFCEANGAPDLLKQVKHPHKVHKQLTQTLTDAEVEALFKALSRVDTKARALFELILLTGLRLSELLQLRFSKAELEAQRVFVKAPDGRKRPVFLGTAAVALLKSYLKRRRIPRSAKARQTLTASLRKAGAIAGIDGVTPSRLRMTYAVRMLLAGHPQDFVAKNLGLDRGSPNSKRRIRQVLVDHLERSNQVNDAA